MKKLVISCLLLLIVGAVGFPGLGDLGGARLSGKLGAATDVVKAATISDADVAGYASQFAKMSDQQSKIAASGSTYASRLERLTKDLKNEDGLKLNFKVYISPEINAFSLADGSIRIHSGIMDKMNDDELLSIIGHEIGHVKNGHSKARFKSAYLASAARKGVASTSGTAGALAASQFGGIAEQLFKAQFSQSNEKDADDYGLKFMKKHKYNQSGAVSALMKLNELGGKSSIFSTHPDSKARAQRLEAQIKK